MPDSQHHPSSRPRSRTRVHFATPITTTAHTTMVSEPSNKHAPISPSPPPPPPSTRSFAQRYCKHSKCEQATTNKDTQYTKHQLKDGVLNVSIPSSAYDTACTSNAGMIGNPFIQTTQKSTKVFSVSDVHQTPGSNIAKLHHPVREPAQTVDMVPDLAGQSLLSGAKFAEAGYISVCNVDEVRFYDSRTVRIVVLEENVLKG